MNKKTLMMIAGGLVGFVFIFSLVHGSLIPANVNKKNIGGCKGTRYGCCPDGVTACNKHCKNCD